MECHVCHKKFRDTYNLQRHLARQASCAPIIDPPEGSQNACRYCGKAFISAASANRHVRLYCKIANTREGMEISMEYTLRKQMVEMEDRMKTQLNAQMTQVAELAALLKGQLVAESRTIPDVQADVTASAGDTIAAQVGQFAQTIAGAHTAASVSSLSIIPWDGDDFIHIPVSLITAAFTENPRLVEFCQLGDAAKADPEIATPYISEALVDLTRRAHADPVSRNIYLNLKRTDQVMVCLKDGGWEVRALSDASTALFDEIASQIQQITVSDTERTQLPF
jgi:hypothetical protein